MESPVLYLVCGLLGGGGAWIISRYAVGLGLMDVPNERSSHEVAIPIPKGGGQPLLCSGSAKCEG